MKWRVCFDGHLDNPKTPLLVASALPLASTSIIIITPIYVNMLTITSITCTCHTEGTFSDITHLPDVTDIRMLNLVRDAYGRSPVIFKDHKTARK